MKRGLILFLALVMLAGCLAACGQEPGPAPDGPSEDKYDHAADPYLPTKDYSGKTYTVLYRGHSQTYIEEWISDEGRSGDVINDAIANRNQAVVDRYGVTLDYDSGKVTAADFDADFLPKITTNTTDDNFQLVAGNTYALATASTRGYFLNWLNEEQIPAVDLTADWWDGDFTQAAKYNGCAYIATGPLSLTDMYTSACIYFNKTLLNNFKGPDATDELFDLVENGGWTLEKLIDYSKDCTYKVEGAEDDSETIFGFSLNRNTTVDAFIYSSNLVMTERKQTTYKGKSYYIALSKVDANSRILSLATTLDAFLNESGTAHAFGDDEFELDFVQDKAVFCAGVLSTAKEVQTKAKELLYGVIPYPKYDEAQTKYYTYKIDYKTGFCIPRSVKENNREFVGTITEALAYYSNKFVKPALYEKVLKHKNVQDQQSSKSVDKILDGGLYEFANIYAGAWGSQEGPAHLLRQCIKKRSSFYNEYRNRTNFYESKLYNGLLDNFSSEDVSE